MDSERYRNLHTIAMLRDMLRKWWRAELTFADETGTVVDWARGAIHPPPNDFCRLALFSREGLRRCSASVRVLHEKFKASGKLRSSQVHQCHLGFTVVGAPLYVDGRYEGLLFVEGFGRQPPSAREGETLKAKITELNPGTTDLERALEKVPILDERALDQVRDLLEFGATEISNFEAEVSRRDQTIQTLSSELEARYRFEKIIGTSAPMVEVFRLLEKVCNSDSTVLVNGESGTGKELVARAIHYNGPRKDKAFVVQNCSAFNDNLLESALFGHVKGAFTGALRDQKGLFETADNGTFFLDEVGDMSPALQVKLLRVLQEGAFLPVGGTQPRQVDVRVIAATHKDLLQLVKKGEFREDLYYRINVIRIQVPSLRERKDDLPVLIEHFLRKHRREGQRTRALAAGTLQVLKAYHWPGNIRELENEIERLLVLGGEHEVIPVELLSSRIADAVSGVAGAKSIGAGRTAPLPSGRLNDAVEHLERDLIAAGLLRTGGNKSQLARELGISRSNLILKIQKYALERASPPHAAEEDAGGPA
jgi:transcriptional regulator with PAS, ATPase and Fis domain